MDLLYFIIQNKYVHPLVDLFDLFMWDPCVALPVVTLMEHLSSSGLQPLVIPPNYSHQSAQSP